MIDSLLSTIIQYNSSLMSTFRNTYVIYVTYNEHIYSINTSFIYFNMGWGLIILYPKRHNITLWGVFLQQQRLIPIRERLFNFYGVGADHPVSY
jgi:hypothetical protein